MTTASALAVSRFPAADTAGAADEAARAAAVLRRRAAALARPPAAAAPAEHLELLVLRIGDEHWGIETRHVHEVAPVRELTPLPGTPAFVRGIVNVRGRVAAVLDLRRLAGLPEQGLSDLHRIVLVERAQGCFGLLADQDVGLRRVPADAIGPVPPALGGSGNAALRGVTPDGLVVLDIDILCSDPRIVIDDESEA